MNPDLSSAPALLDAEEADLMAPGAAEALPRQAPDRSVAQAQHMDRELSPELAADELRPDGERVHDAAHRARLRAVLTLITQDALIYYAATLRFETFAPPPADPDKPQRTRRLRTADEELFAHLWPRYRNHPVYGPALIKIRSGQGHRDDAEDVLALIAILRAELKHNPLTLAGLPWDEAALTALEQDATTQLKSLDQATPAENAARTLRHRAWARFANRYEILRRAGLGLTGDARRFPLLSH